MSSIKQKTEGDVGPGIALRRIPMKFISSIYKSVGVRCGEMEDVGPLARPNCFCIISVSTLLGLLPLLLWWLLGFSTEVTAPPRPYECNAGLAHALVGWPVGKNAWCCDHTGHGRPTLPHLAPPIPRPTPTPALAPVPAPTPAPAAVLSISGCPFDCNAGYDVWPT